MHTRALFSATLLAVATTGFAADGGTWDYWVRVQASVGSIGLSGDASYQDNNVPGTSFDMADVGLDASETTAAFELGLTTPLLSFHAFLGYQDWSTEGSGTLSKTINFGGRTFAQGVAINSSATISDLYGEFCWAPIELNPAGFTIGLAVHQLGMKTEITSVGQSAAFDENILVPTLAVRAYVAPLDMLEVEAMVHGLAVPIGDVSGSFIAGQIQASYYPMDDLGVFAGYRHTMIELEVDDGDMKAEANVALSGPFLGIAAQF